MSPRMSTRVTISGSFNRHLDAVANAVEEAKQKEFIVLSPIDPRIVDYDGSFLFIASDKSRDVRVVQDGHFNAIKKSDFLWVVAPDGYIGCSVSMEIGFAIANGIPVYSSHEITDWTIRKYVMVVDFDQIESVIELLTDLKEIIER